jgi:hypothetical protein
MTLVLGARHVVTGTGQFAISNPIGVAIALAGIPAYVARDTGTPQRFHRMGRVQLGTSIGWRPSVDLVVSPQLVWPLEGEDTVMGYTLLAGCTATIDEVATSSRWPMKAAPWDRAPTAFSRNAFVGVSGPGNATLWTFTVPAGRMLMLGDAMVGWSRTAASTSGPQAQVQLFRGSGALLSILDFANVIGDEDVQQLGPSNLVLLPGEILMASYQVFATGGSGYAQAYASGILFDT